MRIDEKTLKDVVLRVVLSELAKAGEAFVPVMSSNRHIHLCKADVDALFGAGYQLTKLRDLVQPGQYACQETVTLETGKGKILLRVVGPVRKDTQIELSYSDCYRLGIEPVLRMSGEMEGTPGCTLVNGEKKVHIARGIMVAKRHLHMSPEEAVGYGLKDGDVVSLQVEGERAATLTNLVVRSGEGHRLEAHIDKDEANACGLADGQLCRVIYPSSRNGELSPSLDALQELSAGILRTYIPGGENRTENPLPQETKNKMLDLSEEPHCLIAEEQVLTAVSNGYKIIRYRKGAVVTPLARDVASARGVELIELT